jgi:hypothetical protein
VRLSERALHYFRDQDTSLELQGAFLPLFGIGSYSMSRAWVPMGRGVSISSKELYRRQQVAAATCVTSVTCRCDCLCSHRPQKLRFEIVSSVIKGHEPWPVPHLFSHRHSFPISHREPQSLVLASRPFREDCKSASISCQFDSLMSRSMKSYFFTICYAARIYMFVMTVRLYGSGSR